MNACGYLIGGNFSWCHSLAFSCHLCLHSQMTQAKHHPRSKPKAVCGDLSVLPRNLLGLSILQGHICLLHFTLTEVLILTSCSTPHPTSALKQLFLPIPLEFRAAPTPTLEHH